MMIGPLNSGKHLAFKSRNNWAIDTELNEQIRGYYNLIIID